MAPELVVGVPHAMVAPAAMPCGLCGQSMRVELHAVVHARLVACTVLDPPMEHALHVVANVRHVHMGMERAEGRHEEQAPCLHKLITVHGASVVILILSCLLLKYNKHM